ncbi:zinc finger protein 862-like [Rhizophagus irregularis DAOM 181602=DAOM 197198]|uniref:HAT C-terminal dimerisation domain-containing protein n=1 Tax=Rhizophagus irregularis (strain DAOM 181602 / DAOM 197198 / MUCL 43194) TaxID=747089 RepID=U9UFY1_RHIID|nr:zinc finger protein 862-like [Rhizophagus irregularis DAOM 181602=DAOM 197198]
MQLCRALECPKFLSISNPITYENNISGRQMLSAISNSIEEAIWKELDEATAFGIMIDESTDISCEPHLIIYVKYCWHGNIKIRFLKLLQLNGKDSKPIFELVISLFDEKGLTDKLMSFALDGASVMLGKLTGVAARIKERNNKRTDTLRKYQEILEHPILKIKQIYEIRWLSCKIFQRKKIQISDIDPVIEFTLKKIQQEFLDYSDEGRLLLGENLNRFLLNVPSEENCNIERFPDRPLLNSMKIFDHTNWPNNREELTSYEWFGYKAIIYANYKNIEIELLIPKLFEFYYDTFPNIIQLLGIVYFIPFSSVDCERGFSKQNLIKTNLRNSLNIETLHFLMMVGLEEKDLFEFDFTRAIQIWNNECKRRI